MERLRTEELKSNIMNLNNRILLLMLVVCVKSINIYGQVYTILACDTNYTNQFNYLTKWTNLDSVFCPLKANLPKGYYIVIDAQTSDTIMVGNIDSTHQKSGIWKTYGARGRLNEITLFQSGVLVIKMKYSQLSWNFMYLHIPIDTNYTEFIFYHFDEQWKLLKSGISLNDSKVIQYAVSDPISIESWRSADRHGIWIQFKDGTAPAVQYYESNKLIYEVDL